MLFLVTQPSAYAQWQKGAHQWHRQNMMNGNYNSDNSYQYFHRNNPSFYRNMLVPNKSFFALVSLYKLAVDIILSILLITFSSNLIMAVLTRMTAKPFKSGYFGFTFLIIFPLISFILLGLIWLGLAGFLAYGLIFLIGILLAKIFIGWGVLSKIEKGYILDWKAGIVGPLVAFILLFIPIFGWITLAIIFSITTGALLQEFTPHLSKYTLGNKTEKKS